MWKLDIEGPNGAKAQIAGDSADNLHEMLDAVIAAVKSHPEPGNGIEGQPATLQPLKEPK